MIYDMIRFFHIELIISSVSAVTVAYFLFLKTLSIHHISPHISAHSADMMYWTICVEWSGDHFCLGVM